MASSNPFAVPPIGADAGVDKDRRGGGGGAQRAGGGAAPALNGGGVELVATAGPRAATSSPSFEAARALLVAAIPTKPPLAEGDVFLGEDEEVASFEGYNEPPLKRALFLLLGLLTLGVSLLLCKWSPRLRVALGLARCPLGQATYVRVTLRDGRSALEKVELLAPPAGAGGGAAGGGATATTTTGAEPWERLLDHRCHRYFYSPQRGTFLPVPDVPRGFNARLRRAADALARRAPASAGFAAARRALSLVDVLPPAAAGEGSPAPASAGAAGTTTAAAATASTESGGGPFWGGPRGLALAWRRLRYGSNSMVVPVKPLASLVFDEMWHPFYVFQYFSVVVWVAGDSYWSYAACIMAITWFSIVTGSLEAHRNSTRLAGIARFSCRVLALRRADDDGTALGLGSGGGGGGFGGPGAGAFGAPAPSRSPSPTTNPLPSGLVPLKWVEVSSEELVPGDVVAVGTGVLPCDLVLLRGEAIVDENMLTGESVPVRKVAYSSGSDGLNYSPDRQPACTLYGGTCVAQAKFGGGGGEDCAAAGPQPTTTAASSSSSSSLPDPGPDFALAVVVRTRFYSAKGALLRSILHPKEHGEAFVGDSLRFIAVMLAACLLLFVWAAVALAIIGAPASRIVTRFFDMITIAVPPALPACLTIATVFSVARLKEKEVYVTSPGATTAAGQLDVVCFDKTGTLTQQGLELQAIVPTISSLVGFDRGGGGGTGSVVGFGAASADARLLPAALPPLLATCHGLARLADGTIVGDPLDQKLFAASGWGLYDGAHHASRPHPPELQAQVDAVAAAAAAAAAAASVGGGGGVGVGGKPQPPTHVLLDEADLIEAAAAGYGPESPRVLGGGAVDAVATAAPAAAAAGAAGASSSSAAPAAAALPALDPATIQSWAAPPGTAPTLDASHAVVRRFEFSAELQRNAVVVRPPPPPSSAAAAGGAPANPPTLLLYAKGSPEAIRALVDPASVPADFDAVLGGFTREGLRVLALAVGDLSPWVAAAAAQAAAAGAANAAANDATPTNPPKPTTTTTTTDPFAAVQAATQAELETAARPRLLGLAVMANPLRSDSAAVVARLRAATVRCAMVTGDHVRTAVSVSHQCGILRSDMPVLLVDGAALAEVSKGAASASAASAAPPLPPSHPPLPPAAPATTGTAADSFADLSRAAPSHPHYGLGPTALPPHRLSVLYPDGSLDERASRAAALPQALSGGLEVAVTGAGFSRLLDHPDPELLEVVLRRGSVFARMSPDNKRDLMLLLGDGLRAGGDGAGEGEGDDEAGPVAAAVPEHRPLGLHVGFCGDGANDCGALKAAHVGVSLCEAEASVAAPMTSRAQTVACMLTVVGEGRCALVATYQIFQFVVGYAMAQAFATNLLYTHGLMMGNNMYMVQDLLYITVLAALMGRTRPRRDGLAAEKPPGRVVSAPLLVATVAQLVVVAAFQIAALMLLRASPGFTPTKGTPDLKTIVAPETTVIYLASLAQFLVLALVFNRGKPHRQPLFTNLGMVLSLLAQTAFLLYSLFAVDAFTTKAMQLVPSRDPPLTWAMRAGLLGVMLANLLLAFCADAASRPLVRVFARRAAARDEEGLGRVGRRGCCGGLLGVFFSSARAGGGGRAARRGSAAGGGGEAAPLAAAAPPTGNPLYASRPGSASSSGLDLGAQAAAALPAQRLMGAGQSRLGLPPRPPAATTAARAVAPRGDEAL